MDSAHDPFGRPPFNELFKPAIYIAAEGFPESEDLADVLGQRAEDLRRLPETRATVLESDGKPYEVGELFRQPALAHTLAAISAQGSDQMYGGPWRERLAAAVQAGGGYMSIQDLEAYEVIWEESLAASLGEYVVHTMPLPMRGGSC